MKKIGVFGFYASGEQEDIIDIDILVGFAEPVGLEFIDLLEYLEDVLGKKVDLVTPDAVRPQHKESILKKVAYV